MKTFYTLFEIRELRKYFELLKLDGPTGMLSASDQIWQIVCNGTGPDAWPDIARKTVSFFREHKRGATVAHDFRFQWSDGTRHGFNVANSEYLSNSLKEVNYHFPLWQFWKLAHRIREIRQCYTDYLLLDSFGWQSWLQSAQKNELAKTRVKV
jgi:hypothetical protein